MNGFTGSNGPVRIKGASRRRFVAGFRIRGKLPSFAEQASDVSQFFDVDFERFRVHRNRLVRGVPATFNHEVPLDDLSAEGRGDDRSERAEAMIGKAHGYSKAITQELHGFQIEFLSLSWVGGYAVEQHHSLIRLCMHPIDRFLDFFSRTHAGGEQYRLSFAAHVLDQRPV